MHSPREFSDDFVDTGIPVSTGIKIGKRSSRVDYIGDTNGSYAGFLFNAEKLGLIDENGDWIGGSRRLVVLGDVFGDRNMESFAIALQIQKLVSQGATIDWLAGNHDDEALGYFDQYPNGRGSVGFKYFQGHFLFGDTQDIDIFSGVKEFGEFRENFHGQYSWQSILTHYERPAEILATMRGSEKGQAILQALCSLQIGKILDDTLFIHTDPMDAMVDMLETYEWDIEKINALFRSFLLQTLMRGDYSDTATIEAAMKIRTVFLDSFNRRFSDNKPSQMLFCDEQARRLKTHLKIRRIIHGHSDYTRDRPSQPQTIFRGGIEITSADHSSFKRGDMSPWNTRISAGSILQNGHRIEPKPHSQL